jgi:tRNA(Glu) U13 pseudouridine synthase TruD
MTIATAPTTQTQTQTQTQTTIEAKTREVIIRTLRNYPNISLSMLGSHVRPYNKEWRTILEEMIQAEEVQRNVKRIGSRGTFIYSLNQDKEEPSTTPTA